MIILKKNIIKILITKIISQIKIKIANLVKILIFKNNQQITNDRFNKIFNNNKRNKSYLVGISETIRENSNLNNKNNQKFNQWLAGFIDGNGYLEVSKTGYTSCEIIVPLANEKALNQIKNKFGGNIKLRSGINAIRYRLHNKKNMINLINNINDNIRNTKRLSQLHKVSSILNIPIIMPNNLTINNSWFMGFFDAKGSIEYSFKNGHPQLIISVINKKLEDVKMFKDTFGGEIYYDKALNGYYKWNIQNKNDILNFINNYVKFNNSKTIKFNRLMLCHTFYKLYTLQAYNTTSILYKAWIKFDEKWHNK